MKPGTTEVLALLHEHGGRLYALLVRLTLRGDVADDLLQDLFCKLVQNRRFAAAGDPLAYASRVAMNLAFDHQRRQRRSRCGALHAEALATLPTSPIGDVVRREELERVLDAIGRLPANSREIIVLRYLEQQEFEAIGRALGKTAHQARALCHKAMTRLRRLLGENEPDDLMRKRSEE